MNTAKGGLQNVECSFLSSFGSEFLHVLQEKVVELADDLVDAAQDDSVGFAAEFREDEQV